MNTRRPLEPLSPRSPNIAANPYSIKAGLDFGGHSAMEEGAKDDLTQGSGSIGSVLDALEDDTDELGKMMIQNEREERRMRETRRGNLQAFRRAQPRRLTMENLLRNTIEQDAHDGSSSQRRPDRAPSVGSSGSDPAVRPPVQWGRNSRVNRDWLRRTVSIEETEKPRELEADTREMPMTSRDEHTPRQRGRSGILDADLPLPSIEDSPLSHKTSTKGTPTRHRNAALDDTDDWDISLDLNEASIIASTPYIPRNTKLDDIRQREIESLREQAVASSQLDKIRETSPEERRQLKPSASVSNRLPNRMTASEPALQENHSDVRVRKRTSSSISIGKSQPVTGEIEKSPNSPIVVFKGSETVGGLANAQSQFLRPAHGREDSHELLRRLSRVSSSPSPGKVPSIRPRTAPAKQPNTRTDKMPTEPPEPDVKEDVPPNGTVKEPEGLLNTASRRNAPRADSHTEGQDGNNNDAKPESTPQSADADVDDTPIPVEPLTATAKTPRVTGAWIDTFMDTPGPAPERQSVDKPKSEAESPKKGSPSKRSPVKKQPPQTEEPATPPPQTVKPSLPGSALEAIIEEAKAHGSDQENHDGYGDSTIDSLEDIISPSDKHKQTPDIDDDTLQGLELPTGVPKTEAERRRQKEVLHLHNMNARLRAARTSIRDATRGMRRVEHQVDVKQGEETVRVVYQNCPCAEYGHQNPVLTLLLMSWRWFKSLFYDGKNLRRRGFTWLGLATLLFFTWLFTELWLCDKYCHKVYASSMKGYGVDPYAPEIPYVTLSVLSRPLRPLYEPLVPYYEAVWFPISRYIWGEPDYSNMRWGELQRWKRRYNAYYSSLSRAATATVTATAAARPAWEEVSMDYDEPI